MAEKKGYPGSTQQPPTSYVPAPPHPAAAAAYAAVPTSPYGVFPGQAVYATAAQAPPPAYEQTMGHPAVIGQQLYPGSAAAAAAAAAASMYAAAGQGYPQYLGYPTTTGYPMAYTYHPALAYTYPGAQMRPTIMVPNGYDGGARFDGMAQPVLPQPPPGVAPSPAQLAAMAGHNVALTQKKGSFLTGSSDGGYTFW